jgi:hypothetical protein
VGIQNDKKRPSLLVRHSPNVALSFLSAVPFQSLNSDRGFIFQGYLILHSPLIANTYKRKHESPAELKKGTPISMIQSNLTFTFSDKTGYLTIDMHPKGAPERWGSQCLYQRTNKAGIIYQMRGEIIRSHSDFVQNVIRSHSRPPT